MVCQIIFKPLPLFLMIWWSFFLSKKKTISFLTLLIFQKKSFTFCYMIDYDKHHYSLLILISQFFFICGDILLIFPEKSFFLCGNLFQEWFFLLRMIFDATRYGFLSRWQSKTVSIKSIDQKSFFFFVYLENVKLILIIKMNYDSFSWLWPLSLSLTKTIQSRVHWNGGGGVCWGYWYLE